MKKQYKILLLIHIAIILAIIIINLSIKTNIINLLPSCVFREKYNFICPSCGGTRFLISLFEFRIIDAFLYNQLFFFILIYLFIIYISYIIGIITNKKTFLFRWWHIILWGIAIALDGLAVLGAVSFLSSVSNL